MLVSPSPHPYRWRSKALTNGSSCIHSILGTRSKEGVQIRQVEEAQGFSLFTSTTDLGNLRGLGYPEEQFSTQICQFLYFCLFRNYNRNGTTDLIVVL
jgi:hypothetical protein